MPFLRNESLKILEDFFTITLFTEMTSTKGLKFRILYGNDGRRKRALYFLGRIRVDREFFGVLTIKL